jgi:hypothetical protein
LKPVLDRKPQVVSFRYPPFTARSQSIMKFLINNVRFTQNEAFKFILYVSVIIICIMFRNTLFNTCHGIFEGIKNQSY